MLVVSTPPQSIRRATTRSAACRSRGRGSCGGRRGPGRARRTRRGRASRASPGGPGRRPRRGGRAGMGRWRASSRSCALRSRPASAQTALRVSRVGASIGSPGYGSRLAGRASSRPFERRPAAEDEALAERVGGEPVGAVQARAGAFADGVEPLDAGRPPVEVGDDPAHHVVAGGGDRDALRRRVQPRLLQRRDDVREASRVDHRHVQPDRGRAGALEQVVDRAGDGVARVELVDEALAVRAVERRALAADGLGDQEALAALEADDRRRVELGELEVGEHRAGVAREQQAGAEGAGRVGRARPQRGGAAGGEDRGAGREVAAVLEPDAAVLEDRRRAGAFQHLDPRRARPPRAERPRRIRRPVALPPAWMMRRRLWPPSRPSARSPWRSASNCTPSSTSSFTRAGTRRSGPRPRRAGSGRGRR